MLSQYNKIARGAIYILIYYIMSELDNKSDDLSAETIKDLDGNKNPEQEQKGEQEKSPETKDNSTWGEKPQEEWEEKKDDNLVSVEDVLSESEKEKQLQRIREREAKLDKEFKEENAKDFKKKEDNDSKWEDSKEKEWEGDWDKDWEKDKGDEPSQYYQQELEKIKNFTDWQIEEAKEKAYQATKELEAEKKIFKSEKEMLEEKIQKLSKENIELKSSWIQSDDESVARYNYLRENYKKNADDTRWANQLGKFHTRYAATYYDVDPVELNRAIVKIKESEKQASDSLNGWYGSSWGWVSQNINQRIQQAKQKHQLNPELLWS